MAAAAADMGMTGKEIIVSEPHCADENSEMVKTLLSVYTDCTGRESKCLAIGGGTYVHDTKTAWLSAQNGRTRTICTERTSLSDCMSWKRISRYTAKPF